jgi:hypothetical protein
MLHRRKLRQSIKGSFDPAKRGPDAGLSCEDPHGTGFAMKFTSRSPRSGALSKVALCATLFLSGASIVSHSDNAPPIQTPQVDGLQLLNDCGSAPQDVDAAFCKGYIAASIELLRLLSTSEPTVRAACVPDDVETTRAIRIWLDWMNMEKHAEYRHYPASWLVERAFQDEWPCSAEKHDRDDIKNDSHAQ